MRLAAIGFHFDNLTAASKVPPQMFFCVRALCSYPVAGPNFSASLHCAVDR